MTSKASRSFGEGWLGLEVEKYHEVRRAAFQPGACDSGPYRNAMGLCHLTSLSANQDQEQLEGYCRSKGSVLEG